MKTVVTTDVFDCEALSFWSETENMKFIEGGFAKVVKVFKFLHEAQILMFSSIKSTCGLLSVDDVY